MKTTLKCLHVVGLALLCFHFLLKFCFSIGFQSLFLLITKWLVVATAVLLFVGFLKRLGAIKWYFGVYVLGLLLFVIGYVIKGMLGALLLSLTTYPMANETIVSQENTVKIELVYKGFLSSCCTYKVSEIHWSVFEKELGQFSVESVSSKDIFKIETEPETVNILYQEEVYNLDTDLVQLEHRLRSFKR